MSYKFERRVMLFIDGTNFQTQLIKKLGYKFNPRKNPPTSIYSFSRSLIHAFLKKFGFQDKQIQLIFIRNFWFASYKGIGGNKEKYDEIYRALRESEFEPYIFSREKNDKEKGVDITLSKELLVNAFNQNFEVGVLVAGDKDYLELVKEVKRYGGQIFGMFFKEGLSNELKYTFDKFMNLEHVFGDNLDELEEMTSQYLSLKDDLDKVYKKAH